jgi:tryptophan-rich sensory protein
MRAGLAITLILDASVTLWFSANANRVAAVLLIPYFGGLVMRAH